VAAALPPWKANAISKAVTEKNWSQSEALYRELEKTKLPPEQKAKLDYNLGVSLYRQDKFEESLKYFDSAAKLEGDSSMKAKALYNKGNALFRLDKLPEAKQAYQQALLSNPEDDDARRNIEVILEKEKQDQKNNKNDQQDEQDKQNDQSDQKDDSQGKDKKDQGEDQKKDQKQGDSDEKEQDQSKGEGKDQKEKPAQPEMTEAERKAAQEAAERARLLDYFEQQEKDGRPGIQVKSQAPPVRGKTW
jgi:tetratricopeptide (TPR) repeat protein